MRRQKDLECSECRRWFSRNSGHGEATKSTDARYLYGFESISAQDRESVIAKRDCELRFRRNRFDFGGMERSKGMMSQLKCFIKVCTFTVFTF